MERKQSGETGEEKEEDGESSVFRSVKGREGKKM